MPPHLPKAHFSGSLDFFAFTFRDTDDIIIHVVTMNGAVRRLHYLPTEPPERQQEGDARSPACTNAAARLSEQRGPGPVYWVTHLRRQTATTRPPCPSLASSGTAGWPPAAAGRTRSAGRWGSSCLRAQTHNGSIEAGRGVARSPEGGTGSTRPCVAHGASV